MRLLLSLLCLMIVTMGAAAGDPQPIMVAVGEEFELVLDSPADSNRQWLLSKPLDERLQQCGRRYRNNPGPDARPRTCEVLKYKAVATGRAEVHLKFASLQEREQAPPRSTNFVVIVTSPKSQGARK